ncbi:large conductance mechanosensitive channel protein MscL [Novosphingobium sp. B 225]|uniref:large conductance mechanosensitive channel protein MscL n=1 Tax=Novosphingobium sp. B 225 TaxID=1961849 RepID=UPI0015951EBD|nr:large conductance mechanosensitive channel protein MscL [Novosphingobium sp. B 225]
MMSEFKEFISKGNVLDLAVGVIIGAAFGKIVTSLTEDLIMPLIGKVFGGLDFTSKYIVLSGEVAPGTPLAAAREAGANVLAYGSFFTALINFVIMAWVIFMIVKAANKAMPAAPAAPAGPSEVDLLTEIRDALKK